MNHEISLTPARYAELQAELEELVTVERTKIAERIRQARALGDLSENFDYQDAKRQQGFLEGKIQGLKKMLEKAHVAEYQAVSDTVVLGSTVVVYDADFDEDIEYTIVGALDADPSKSRISNTSPIGTALLDKKVGETVKVQIPAGVATYKVKAIK